MCGCVGGCEGVSREREPARRAGKTVAGRAPSPLPARVLMAARASRRLRTGRKGARGDGEMVEGTRRGKQEERGRVGKRVRDCVLVCAKQCIDAGCDGGVDH
eukprot:2140141-Pleurochrysis_carterae.AAC.1